MFVVYILYSDKDKDLYVGQTRNLEERLKRHNNGYLRLQEITGVKAKTTMLRTVVRPKQFTS